MYYEFDVVTKRMNEMSDLYQSLKKKMRKCSIRFPKQSLYMIISMLLLLGSIYFLILSKIPENPFFYMLIIVPIILRVIVVWSMSDFPQENIENTFKAIDINVKQKLIIRKLRLLKRIRESRDSGMLDDLMLELDAKALGEHSLVVDTKEASNRILIKDFMPVE